MNKAIIPLLIMIAASAVAHAGPVTSPKQIIPPPAAPCLWDWFAGGSVGYVSGDWNEEIYTAHVGVEYDCGGDTHSIFLEVGYTEKDGDIDHWKQNVNAPPDYFLVYAKTEIIPITLNYKFESSINDKWSWYVGIGAGVALVDLDIKNTHPSFSHEKGSWSDTVFYSHVFAGVIYKINSSFELFGGVRYIYMADASLSGVNDFDDHATLDGDLHFEIGGRYKF